MLEFEFRKYLKKKGKKDNVIERNVKGLHLFETFLQDQCNKNDVSLSLPEDINSYVSWLEKEQHKSAKGYLYELINYFSFSDNQTNLKIARSLREERTSKTRKKFLIRDMMGINKKYVSLLADKGIKTFDDMLKTANTPEKRLRLHEKTDIPMDALLEITKISDIARAGYLRTKLSRLLYNAGVDSIEKLASWDPKKLREHLRIYITKNNWDGMVPLLGDLTNYVNSAKKLEPIVLLK